MIESGFFGKFDNYELINTDFLTYTPDEPFQACVTGEVLEHVETPEKFLEKIAASAAADAFIFVSTCINAPVVDHIYNFSSLEHLEGMMGSAGLDVDKRLLLPHAGKSVEQCLSQKLPLSMANILRKARQVRNNDDKPGR